MAWGQAYKSHLEKLLKLQKRGLRFIYFSERNQHAIPLFIDAGVLPLKFLHYDLLANLMFEIRHRNAPGNIQDLFQDISNIHSYNTPYLTYGLMAWGQAYKSHLEKLSEINLVLSCLVLSCLLQITLDSSV